MQESRQKQLGKLTNYILDEKIREALNKKGVKYLFPIQYQTYKDIITGNDIMGRDQTGSGKTLAYVLPIINRFRHQKVLGQAHPNPKFVVILPTRELAIQVEDEINSLKIQENEYKVGLIIGQTSMTEQYNLLNKGVDIIVGTPGRLSDLMKKQAIPLYEMQMFCLDEADEMLELGFRQTIHQILKLIQKNSRHEIQVLMFSATFTSDIVHIAEKYLRQGYITMDLLKGKPLKVPAGIDHVAINYNHQNNERQNNKFISQLIIKYAGQNGSIMIFCQTKRQAQNFYNRLNIPQTKGRIHGDIEQNQRSHTFKGFKSGQIKCLISTNVSARGLDFPLVDLVIQLQPPKKTDHYVHRCGRTGRAGRKGTSVVLWNNYNIWRMNMIRNEAMICFNQVHPQYISQYSTQMPKISNSSSKVHYVEKNSMSQYQQKKCNNFIMDLIEEDDNFEFETKDSSIKNHVQKVNKQERNKEPVSLQKNYYEQTILQSDNIQNIEKKKEQINDQKTIKKCASQIESPQHIEKDLLLDKKEKIIKAIKTLKFDNVQMYELLAKQIYSEMKQNCLVYFIAYVLKTQQESITKQNKLEIQLNRLKGKPPTSTNAYNQQNKIDQK